jgi:hypothetical protein
LRRELLIAGVSDANRPRPRRLHLRALQRDLGRLRQARWRDVDTRDERRA